MSYPSRTTLPPHKPYYLTITDSYGESISLSDTFEHGDVLNMSVSAYTEAGEPLTVQFAGNFHQDDRQNSMNFLARLRGMMQISEQENQQLVLVVPHPQIEMRGRVTNLVGPTWAGTPAPGFYAYTFEFTKEPEARQPKIMRPLTDATRFEGKDYVTFTIPSADFTNVRDLAYNYYGERYSDGAKIKKILELNNMSLSDSRLSVGQVVKMPPA